MTDFNFTSISNMENNDAYKTSVRDKAKKLMDGKESITADKAFSIFKGYNKNLSPEMADKIQKIAAMDGDSNVSLSEMSAIYALFDMELDSDGEYHFDNKIGGDDAKFGIEASDKDVLQVVNAFKTEEEKSAAKKMEHIDPGKYDTTKPFEEKISSNDVDEVMLALQKKLSTGYVDKRTGKPVSVTQAVVMFEDYIAKHKDEDNAKIAKDFTEETGIPVTSFYKSRSGIVYTICDYWERSKNISDGDDEIKNTATGEFVYGRYTGWEIDHSYTIPFATGQRFKICGYQNSKKGIEVVFGYGKENTDCVAPTGANIYIKGRQPVMVKYDDKSAIDPDLYNFIEK